METTTASKTQIRTVTVGEANRGGVRASSKRSTSWPEHERCGAGGRMTSQLGRSSYLTSLLRSPSTAVRRHLYVCRWWRRTLAFASSLRWTPRACRALCTLIFSIIRTYQRLLRAPYGCHSAARKLNFVRERFCMMNRVLDTATTTIHGGRFLMCSDRLEAIVPKVRSVFRL